MPDETPTETVSAADLTPTDMPEPTSPAGAGSGAGGSAPPPPLPADAPKDSAGVPFDPARHSRATNRHTGRWMPRGGRKPGSPAKAPQTPVASFIPAKVPSLTPDPVAAETKAPESPEKSEPSAGDHSADAGEVIARAAQMTAGIILDAPKETTASPTEHKHMVNATAAYIRSKGWQASAGVGLLLMFAAWLFKVIQQPAPQAKVRSWFGGGGEPRDVTPEAAKPRAPVQADRHTPADVTPNIPPLARP